MALEYMVDQLSDFIQHYPRLLTLTGAGVSLASGIPTYRDEKGEWQRGQPIQHYDFIKSEATRRRYWARSFRGWPHISSVQPNNAHHALAQLEKAGHIALLITQNVDNLHQKANSEQVVDLHGNLTRVICLDCGATLSRDAMQAKLAETNPQLTDLVMEIRPDGDAQLDETFMQSTQIPACDQCAGVLMPDVIFFGGMLPPKRVQFCLEALEQADALLVVGSSLKVYSGYRFCVKAKEWHKPIALLNPGWTRADDLATLKIAAPCSEVLQKVNGTLSCKT